MRVLLVDGDAAARVVLVSSDDGAGIHARASAVGIGPPLRTPVAIPELLRALGLGGEPQAPASRRRRRGRTG